MTPRYALPGSDRREIQPHGVVHPACNSDERIGVTIRLTNNSPETMQAVASWLLGNDIAATDLPDGQMLLKAVGSVENLERAFGVKMEVRETDCTTYRDHYGPITIPAQLAGMIASVHGLDDRQIAKPRLVESNYRSFFGELGELLWHDLKIFGPKPYAKPPGTFTPLEVAEAYQFPAGTGEGQTIALIELGGGFRPRDLTTYWEYLGIEGPVVSALGVNGGRNQPGQDADSEVMLDIEIVGALCPKAKIVCVFTGNTERDFLDALSTAIHSLKADVVSISWGGPEDSYTEAALTAFNSILEDAAKLGVTVLVAAGDNGSSDGVEDGKNHCDFPASSPWALSCGGSRLVANGATIESEVVWNETANDEGSTGGGCSSFFKRPEYQTIGICGDMNNVPDVAGLADPETGFVTRVDGRFSVSGGTSAVAPLFAGLIARINQITGKRAGFINPLLYSKPGICRDIVSGDNGSFTASVGNDPTTGLGSIVGTKLLEALK